MKEDLDEDGAGAAGGMKDERGACWDDDADDDVAVDVAAAAALDGGIKLLVVLEAP